MFHPPLLRREALCARPPPPREVSRCLAGVLGESRDSGLGLGFDARPDLAVLTTRHERFARQSRNGALDSRKELKTGDLPVSLDIVLGVFLTVSGVEGEK